MHYSNVECLLISDFAKYFHIFAILSYHCIYIDIYALYVSMYIGRNSL